GADVISSKSFVSDSKEHRVDVDDSATQMTSVVANTFDFGDAPKAYGTLLDDTTDGARHRLSSGLFLGKGVDAELNGKPNTAAAGDKDDGVTLPGYLVPGLEASISVVSSGKGILNAWIDF